MRRREARDIKTTLDSLQATTDSLQAQVSELTVGRMVDGASAAGSLTALSDILEKLTSRNEVVIDTLRELSEAQKQLRERVERLEGDGFG